MDITLSQKFWGMGIGALPLGELEVVFTNAPAVALYKKLGFQAAGAIPHALRYPDGKYIWERLFLSPKVCLKIEEMTNFRLEGVHFKEKMPPFQAF